MLRARDFSYRLDLDGNQLAVSHASMSREIHYLVFSMHKMSEAMVPFIIHRTFFFVWIRCLRHSVESTPIHPRSLKTRGLGRAAVARPQSGHSTASDKHHLR
jgi:hypothetical protein